MARTTLVYISVPSAPYCPSPQEYRPSSLLLDHFCLYTAETNPPIRPASSRVLSLASLPKIEARAMLIPTTSYLNWGYGCGL